MNFKNIYENLKKNDNEEIKIICRIRSNRVGKNVSFLNVDDGSTILDTQIVYKNSMSFFDEISKLKSGSIIEVTGKIILTPNSNQPFEIDPTIIEIIDETNDNYPLQKKEHSFEFLRDISHLRSRTKTFQSVFRIRSSICFAIHDFFIKHGYIYANTPIITENDAEGAGESFIVTTINNDKYENDFFAKKASLTVSGQLHTETLAQSFKKVYTFGPTFRAEKSNTTKHAAEFWMLEPEIADVDLTGLIVIIESLIKYIINYVFENNSEDLKFCEKQNEENLIKKLKHILESKFEILEYLKAIEILQKAVKNGKKFNQNKIEFGLDLGTEHERFICEEYTKKPTFLINYPKNIKAFYMKQNSDNKTVAAVDLLFPYIGELVGGSQREDSKEKIIKRCNELKIDLNGLKWYLDLRDSGYYKTSGFGMGLDRLIMYITGIANIRDVIPFSRTVGNLQF